VSSPAPRTADGKPNLSGMWMKAATSRTIVIPADGSPLPFTPTGEAIYEQRRATNQKDLPSSRCIAQGIPATLWVPVPFKIVTTPGLTLMLFEEFRHFRQIFTDGRPFTGEDAPSWFGYSVGKWDGDTFVVESRGFTDQSWLDLEGLPHSEALRLTERYRRKNVGTMEVQVGIEDDVMFTKPWTAAPVTLRLVTDTELLERICENEKDREHLVGK